MDGKRIILIIKINNMLKKQYRCFCHFSLFIIFCHFFVLSVLTPLAGCCVFGGFQNGEAKTATMMFSLSRSYMEWDVSSGCVKILFKLIDRDTIEIGRYFGYTMRPLNLLGLPECGMVGPSPVIPINTIHSGWCYSIWPRWLFAANLSFRDSFLFNWNSPRTYTMIQ